MVRGRMGTLDKHVVIVGGGFGGLAAARDLAGAPIQVTLVDRENHHLFQPLLYQVATAGLAPGSIAVPIRGVVAGQKNVRVYLGEAKGVDFERKRLQLADGAELRYDYLIVAVGAKTNYFGNDEWAEHAHGMKDLRDAIRVRERVLLAFEAAEREEDPAQRRKLLTFAVIGGGATGVEMAGAISELGRQVLASDFRRIAPEDIRVVLIEMADSVLGALDEDLQHSALDQLEDLGVEVWLGTRVTHCGPEGVRVAKGEDDEEELRTAVTVWASGVRPVSFIEKMGVETSRDGRAIVDSSCALPGHPDVFVVGDCAAFYPEDEEDALPGVAPVAMQQGRHVAKTIRRELKRKTRETFEYTDKGTMATIGRSRAVVQAPGFKLTGLMAWLAWCVVHVMYLIGFRNRFIVMFNWFWSYLTYKRGARLITARYDPTPGNQPDPLHLESPLHRHASDGLQPDDAAEEAPSVVAS